MQSSAKAGGGRFQRHLVAEGTLVLAFLGWWWASNPISLPAPWVVGEGLVKSMPPRRTPPATSMSSGPGL